MGVFPHRVGCVGDTSSVAAPSGSRCLSLTSMYETHQSEGPLSGSGITGQTGSAGGSRSKLATR